MWNDPAWAFGIAFIIVAISLRKALPRLLHSIADRQSPPGPSDEAVEELRHRLSELEERVDFAERMLSRQRDVDGLVPPQS